MGGHLATITSQAENEFIFSLIDKREYCVDLGSCVSFGPSIGGFQPPGSLEPDKNWLWVTGEPFKYTNWLPGPDYSPNNWPPGNPDCLHFFHFQRDPRKPYWNDQTQTGYKGVTSNSFVVEFEPPEHRKSVGKIVGPQSVHTAIRQAVTSCSRMLPKGKRSVSAIRAEILRILDQELKNLEPHPE